MTFLKGIVDPCYSALHDILMENDGKKYNDCILALRKKAVDTEENRRGLTLTRILANITPESPEQDVQAQEDGRYLPKELWESSSFEQKKMYKAYLHCVKTSMTLLI